MRAARLARTAPYVVTRTLPDPQKDKRITELEERNRELANQVRGLSGRIAVLMTRIESQQVATPIKPNGPKLREIINRVAREFNVTANMITGPCREQKYVLPRHVAFDLGRELTGHGTTYIGYKIGDVDHTTVLHGWRRIKGQRIADEELNQRIIRIEQALSADAAPAPDSVAAVNDTPAAAESI